MGKAPVYLAVDAGGTASRSALVDASGTCVGRGLAGGGNPTSHGAASAVEALRRSAAEALEKARISGAQVQHTVVALAGIGLREEERETLVRALKQIGIRGELEVTSDATAAFASGSDAPCGHVLIVGTGAAALRIEDGQVAAAADGLGWLLGDLGSGAWFGHQVVSAAAADLDGRGPATPLTPEVLGAFGIPLTSRRDQAGRNAALAELLTAVYAEPPVRLARFGPLAFQDEADPVSAAIVSGGAQELARTLSTVLGSVAEADVVGTGSVLVRQQRLRTLMLAELASSGHDVALTLVPDGLAGAALRALQNAGIETGPHIRAAIRASLGAGDRSLAVPIEKR
jgi:glucosamine kinase